MSYNPNNPAGYSPYPNNVPGAPNAVPHGYFPYQHQPSPPVAQASSQPYSPYSPYANTNPVSNAQAAPAADYGNQASQPSQASAQPAYQPYTPYAAQPASSNAPSSLHPAPSAPSASSASSASQPQGVQSAAQSAVEPAAHQEGKYYQSSEAPPSSSDSASSSTEPEPSFLSSLIENFTGLSAAYTSKYHYQQAIKQDPGVLSRSAEDEEAINEHKSFADVPLTISTVDMITRIGRGVSWYFGFLKCLSLLNIFLCLISLINLIPHLIYLKDNSADWKFPDFLYLSSYDSSVRPYWMTSSIISVVVCFLFGPVYRAYVHDYQRGRQRGDADYVEDPFEGQYRVDSDDCVDRIDQNRYLSGSSVQARRLVSLVAFAAVIVLQAVVNYYVHMAAQRLNSATATALLISVLIRVFNFAGPYVCKYLTRLEGHRYWSDYRRWDCFKVFIFRVANLFALYFVKRMELKSRNAACPLEEMASQFFYLIVVDISLNSLVAVLVPAAKHVYGRRAAERNAKSNDANKPEFILSDEYVQIVYRQFAVFYGLLVMPSLPFLALAGNLIEYWLDKIRLLRISQKPKPTKNTFKNVLVAFGFLSGLVVILGFPNGAAWVLSGNSGVSQCSIFY